MVLGWCIEMDLGALDDPQTTPIYNRSRFNSMNKLLTILCLVLLSVHSYSQEVFTGPFLIRDGITYHQETNEPITGIVEEFYDNGQLWTRWNYKDGKQDGLFEFFHDNGQLQERQNYKDGEYAVSGSSLTKRETWLRHGRSETEYGSKQIRTPKFPFQHLFQ